MDEANARWNGVDILVNNAGVAYRSVVEHFTEQDDRDEMSVNFNGPMELIRLALPKMREKRAGRIISISSVGGMMAMPTMALYSASKFAVIALPQTLALELAAEHINVNAICPGVIMETGMRERAEAELKAMRLPSAEERVSLIPLGRLGKPDDVARVAAFLASDEAAYMTGQSINVTGGLWLD